MKSLSHLFVWTAAAAFCLLGCERHELDETSVLHLEHGAHEEGHGDHSGDDHGKKGHDGEKDHHGKGDDHGKKKDSHGAGDGEKEEPRKSGI